MEEEAARRLGRPGGDARPGRPGDGRALRRPVVVDDVERLGGRVDQLDGAGDDAPERVPPDLLGEAGPGEGLGRARVELVGGEGDPRRRAEQVDLAGVGPRLERVRPADLVLAEGRPPSRTATGRGRRSRRSGRRSSGIRSGGGARRAAARGRRSAVRGPRRRRPSRARCRAPRSARRGGRSSRTATGRGRSHRPGP